MRWVKNWITSYEFQKLVINVPIKIMTNGKRPCHVGLMFNSFSCGHFLTCNQTFSWNFPRFTTICFCMQGHFFVCWGSASTVTIAKIFFTSPQHFQTCLMGQLCPKLLHVHHTCFYECKNLPMLLVMLFWLFGLNLHWCIWIGGGSFLFALVCPLWWSRIFEFNWKQLETNY